MKALLDWAEQRSGYRRLLHETLFENVPGGARWRYVWGSTLTFCFVVQVLTGLALWLGYSPSSQTAWESVYYIQNVMWGGWFLRGLHHFTAQAMTVLLVLHLMQVVIDGAYQAPREVNYWFGLGLLLLVLALSLTGYLLPWDQKGFWATKVATNIAGITPVIGSALQRVIIGGTSYGHQTLTRFFALHAGFVPGAIVVFIAAHIYLFRRHGLTPKEPRRKPDAAFWPDQVLRDAVACLAVLAVVVFFTTRYHGAPLGAPADPAQPFAAARPEWYFLFLFQFLKYFPGGTEVWGAIVIPALLLALVAALPLVARWRLGHRFNLGLLGSLLAGVAVLTVAAVREDRGNPAYVAAVAHAELDAGRAVMLAGAPAGIPVAGAAALLRADPLTQGPRLFAANCASCHRYDGHDGLGVVPKDKPTASDLKGFASREWFTGFFAPEKIATPQYLGGTRLADSDMTQYVLDDVAKFPPETKEELRLAIIALSAGAQLPAQHAMDARDAGLIADGRRNLVGGSLDCIHCHRVEGRGKDEAPHLDGLGSRAWLVAMISDPGQADSFGGFNEGMPAFGRDQRLTQEEIGIIADWLRGDWYQPADR